MKLCESQFIWLTTWVSSLCSPCSLVHKDFKWSFLKIYLAKYLRLFTLFNLFTCSWWFEWGFLNFNSFDQVFESVLFVHLVHMFSRIWTKLFESQFVWLSIWVCSLCSLVHFVHLFTLFTCSLVLKDLNEALWISIHLTNYLSLFTLFTFSQEFEWSSVNLNSFD